MYRIEKKTLEVGTVVRKSNGVVLVCKQTNRGMATMLRSFRNNGTGIYEQIPVVHILKCSLYSVEV